ncbi:hypothetical protein SAMN02927900_04067 [Rhizobium mongolense subsp. loessense]|uniref:Uncharacterized protein n=1 Tax=Rhizobium mongolense subsp. loessense TaxID=158890 RepID=A0A1G4SS43_9HYPH|nr:hypothetical protein [Rhizobium mongolense]SCW71109.1 hypothetical protein SAMN02927900_04067 [Rhizobium mongolense subsp. loessense]
MKRTSLILFALMFAVEPSFAIERLNAGSTTCAAAQRIIARDGAAILRYPSETVPGMTLYKRYVRNKAQCDSDDEAAPTSVKTADEPRCRLARCRSSSHNQSTSGSR